MVRAGFKNTPDDQYANKKLIAFAKEHCSPAMVLFLFEMRGKLAALIDDI